MNPAGGLSVGGMLPQENPAGGLSVGGLLPRYSAGGPEGARPHEPARRSLVAGMPRDPAVGVALRGMLSQRYGGMLPNFHAGGLSVGGMLPQENPAGGLSVGGMLPR